MHPLEWLYFYWCRCLGDFVCPSSIEFPSSLSRKSGFVVSLPSISLVCPVCPNIFCTWIGKVKVYLSHANVFQYIFFLHPSAANSGYSDRTLTCAILPTGLWVVEGPVIVDNSSERVTFSFKNNFIAFAYRFWYLTLLKLFLSLASHSLRISSRYFLVTNLFCVKESCIGRPWTAV